MPTNTAEAGKTGLNDRHTKQATNIFDILSIWPILDNVCARISFRDLRNLRISSRQFSQSYETVLKHQWNINSLLKHFVGNPDRFRAAMAHHNAIISANAAFYFFYRCRCKMDCLDIYIKGDCSPAAFAQVLCDEEDYKFGPYEANRRLTLYKHVRCLDSIP